MAESKPQANRMIKHSTIYAIGNISRQLVGFLMLPVYTRFLSPADYGVLGLLALASALIESLFGARLALAMPKFYYEKPDESYRNAVISTAMITTGVISLFTTAILFLARESFSFELFGVKGYETLLGLYAVLILTIAIENYGMIFIRIQQRPILFIVFSMAKLVMQLSLNIWLVVGQHMGVMGVAVGGVASSLLFALMLTLYTFYWTGIRLDFGIAKRMLIFSWPLWVSGLASLYIHSGNRYYIKMFSTLGAVGLYELGAKFANILDIVIWEPFAQYWQVERFNIYQKGNAEVVFQSTFRFISALMLLGVLGISIFSGPVLELMSAPEFHGAEKVVAILTFGVFFSCLTTFSNFSFLVKEKTGWIGRNNYYIAALISVFYLGLIPSFGFVGAAVAWTLSQLAQFLMVHYSARKFYDMKIELRPLFHMSAVVVVGYLVACEWASGVGFWLNILIRAIVFASVAALFVLLLLRDYKFRAYLSGLDVPYLNRLINKSSAGGA